MRVVFTFLGTNLDADISDKRWAKWRPSVGLCGHSDFIVDKLVILTCDDKREALTRVIVEDIGQISPGTKVETVNLNISDPWSFEQVYAALYDYSRTQDFNSSDQYFVHLATGTHVCQICLFLLTESRHFPAVLLESFSHGAQDSWKGRIQLIDLNLSSYDQLASRFKQESLSATEALRGGIRTLNPAFNELISDIERVALKSNAPILLTGPTGAGKSELAKRIQALKKTRRLVKEAFCSLNCATLRGDNALSALFGHKKGAFTGASSDRSGALKLSDQGVLFLDEIGELGLEEQSMLLCAIESGTFYPLGSDRPESAQFVLIAGTNKDLALEVKKGLFRADLLARINTWEFKLPGLAQRIEDLEPNLEYELESLSVKSGSNVTISAEAKALYLSHGLKYSWPGNFRDLSSSVHRMYTLSDGNRITVRDVEKEWNRLNSAVVINEPALESLTYCKLVLADRINDYDLVELAQLECILKSARESRSMAEASRKVFAVSRSKKSSTNDSDRIKKYLGNFELTFELIKSRLT